MGKVLVITNRKGGTQPKVQHIGSMVLRTRNECQQAQKRLKAKIAPRRFLLKGI